MDEKEALALANKATQIGGVPFAVSEYGDNRLKNPMDVFLGFGGNKTQESDLVAKIRMGLIK